MRTGIVAAHRHQPDLIWRHRVGPDDPVVVMAGLDDRAHQPRHADAVAAHVRSDHRPVGPRDTQVHGVAIFGSEIEDMPDLDPPARSLAVGGDLGPTGFVVGLVGRGVGRVHPLEQCRQPRLVGIIEPGLRPVEFVIGGVVKDLALAGRRQHDELVGKVAADRARGRPHWHRLDAEPLKGAKIGQHLLVIAQPRGPLVEVEAVGVLHQELAPPHHPEARADLVPKLPLDMIKRARQLAIGARFGREDRGDQLLVGRPVEQFAPLPVLQSQHLGAIGVVAPALPPQIGRLQGRHQQLDRPGPVLLLAHDLLDLAQDLEAERKPGIDAGGGLANQPRAQHQLVADDLGVGGALLEHRQKSLGKAHGPVPRGGAPNRQPAHNCGDGDTAMPEKPDFARALMTKGGKSGSNCLDQARGTVCRDRSRGLTSDRHAGRPGCSAERPGRFAVIDRQRRPL